MKCAVRKGQYKEEMFEQYPEDLDEENYGRTSSRRRGISGESGPGQHPCSGESTSASGMTLPMRRMHRDLQPLRRGRQSAKH